MRNRRQAQFMKMYHEQLNKNGMTLAEILAANIITEEDLEDLCKRDIIWEAYYEDDYRCPYEYLSDVLKMVADDEAGDDTITFKIIIKGGNVVWL